MNPNFLTIEQIVDLHDSSIAEFGGRPGILDLGMLNNCTFAPQASWGGEYLYPSIPHMVCAYWHSFTCGHCFNDGNKRIGLASAQTFAYMNGYRITMSSAEVEDMTLRLARGELSKEELYAEVGSRIRAF